MWAIVYSHMQIKKFTNVFVRAFTKSVPTGLHFGKPSYRLENCHATVSLILCCLC